MIRRGSCFRSVRLVKEKIAPGDDVFAAMGDEVRLGAFTNDPGPAPVTGGGGGDIPAGEPATLIGIVVMQSQSCWHAYRTQRWGGSESVGNRFEDARRFIEAGVGGRLLRQEPYLMADGTHAIRFWNDSYVP